MASLIFIAIVVWIAPLFVAHDMGKRKHRGGFVYGFLLGWIGVLILACLGDAHPDLPPHGTPRIAAAPALTSTQIEIRQLEDEIHLANLKRQREEQLGASR